MASSCASGLKISSIMNLGIAALGFAFSVTNAVTLSDADAKCRGFTPDERNFLFVISIVLAGFFGLLSISSIYTIACAYTPA